jgi:hypothetical protein
MPGRLHRLVGGLLLVLLAASAGWARGASPQGAFLRSLLIPGWGQRYVGRSGAAGRFAAAELVLWGGFAGCRRLNEVRKDEYRTYAALHAGARTGGQDARFFEDLGFYQSTLEHDLYARLTEGPAPDVYPDDPVYQWEWDAEASRLQYRDLRSGAERARRGAVYSAGLVAANHLVSAIHAARAAARTPAATSLEVRPAFDGLTASVGLSLVRHF